MNDIAARKVSHLDLCVREDVEARGTTLLEQVHLVHEALPELSVAEVDTSCEVFGRRLQAPVLVSGMSGGAARARDLNRALAAGAQKAGIGMGVGSQRAMLVDPESAESYRVRDVAPDILLLANLGAVQARESGLGRVTGLVEAIGADALCIHLNAAQELVQDEGDRDFRGCLATIETLATRLPVPVIVKETGCGLAPRTLARLFEAGVRTVDVSGAGGTTWTGVEAMRGSARQRALGRELREWGIPTAASVLFSVAAGMRTIASGGLRDARDCVVALALGADLVSLALPFLRAWSSGGEAGVLELAERLGEGIRALMVLCGARRIQDLRSVPRVLGPELRSWMALMDADPRPPGC